MPFIVASGYKIIGQTVFLIAGLVALALHEREAGMLILGMAGGSLLPVAEKVTDAKQSPPAPATKRRLPRVTVVKEDKS